MSNETAGLVSEVQDLQHLSNASKKHSDEKAIHAIQIMDKQNPDLADALKLAQLQGSWKMASAFQRISAGATVSSMASLLEGNRFKKLPIEMEDGAFRAATDKDEFCRLVFNKTRSQCSELISDFKACNNDIELYDAYVSLGLHRDQRRLFRKLPEAEREEAINSAVENGDKAEVLDLIESMAARHAEEKEAHAREKEELEQQLQRTNSEREADKRLLADKDQKINEQARELRRDFSPDEEKQRLQELDSQQKLKLKEKEFACIAAINEFSQVVDEVFERESLPDHVEESMYGSLRGVFRHALLVARDKGINPDQLLGLPIDASVLDQYS